MPEKREINQLRVIFNGHWYGSRVGECKRICRSHDTILSNFQVSAKPGAVHYGLDLLVESSEDLERKMGLQFWRDAITSGTVLYERK